MYRIKTRIKAGGKYPGMYRIKTRIKAGGKYPGMYRIKTIASRLGGNIQVCIGSRL